MKFTLHTCLFYNGQLAYNGMPLLTIEMSQRCGIIDTYKHRQCTSDFVNKASKVIESLLVPVTLNLIPLLLTMSSERNTHIACLSGSLFIFIEALKRSELLSFISIRVNLLLQRSITSCSKLIHNFIILYRIWDWRLDAEMKINAKFNEVELSIFFSSL